MKQQTETFLEFDDFINTPFQGEINAHCLKRKLIGDFKEITYKLTLREDITEISITQLNNLELSTQGKIARELIINDFTLLKKIGAQPSLNLLKAYQRDTIANDIRTDVYSFHVDSSPIETNTFLCTYYGATSDILPNEMAILKTNVPEIREQIINEFEITEEEFESFIDEYHFNLHYKPKENAELIDLKHGDLWKLAIKHPNQKVAPCIHRAPFENNELRLLLIC